MSVLKLFNKMCKIRVNIILKIAFAIMCPLSIFCSQPFIRKDIKELNKLNKEKIQFTQIIEKGNTELVINENAPKISIAPKPMIFSPIEGKLWVEECVKQYKEILWLADSDVRITEEGEATLERSYSEQLFGQKYIEFDRTIMTIHCLKLISDGSDKAHETFTAAQPENVKLSKKSFNTFHLEVQSLLKSGWEGLSEWQIAQAMETDLVIGDIGKSEKARTLFKPYGIGAPDHDDFHGELMQEVLKKHPKMCPSFAKLSAAAKKLLINTANLAHLGHIIHSENGLRPFTGLKENIQLLKDPIILRWLLTLYKLDASAALGHLNNQSSLVYTEPTHLAMQAMEDAIKVLLEPEKEEIDAFNAYLKKRASWLGLNSTDKYDRVLTRIGAMLRLFTVEEGEILKKAMNDLDSNIRDKIALALDIKEKEPLNPLTRTYLPAVLGNLLNNKKLGKSREERLDKAIKIGLPFIARVLEQHKELVIKGEIDPKIPLCFNRAAGVAKESPNLLSGKFKIDEEGNVLLCTK